MYNQIKEALSTQQFEKIRGFITSTYGIKIPDKKHKFLESRLRSRLLDLNLDSYDDYLRYLFSREGKPEISRLEEVVVTNKTDFFREPRHFDYLEEIIPQLTDESTIRIWSAGCSSGEEVYTLAMVLAEMEKQNTISDFEVMGSDISDRMLTRARRGIYKEDRTEDIPYQLRKRYLLKGKGNASGYVKIDPSLQRKVKFSKFNLNEPHYSCADKLKFHIIFCRNTLIYFAPAQQEMIVNRLAWYIKPEGYLFTGHSESLMGLKVKYKQILPAVYQKTGK